MKSDITKRLRDTAKRYPPSTARLFREAADEIEELRHDVDYLIGREDEDAEPCSACGVVADLHPSPTGWTCSNCGAAF